MKNLHRAFKVSNQKVRWLQAKVDKLIANEAVCLQDGDSAYISHVTSHLTYIWDISYSPTVLLLEGQSRFLVQNLLLSCFFFTLSCFFSNIFVYYCAYQLDNFG